MTTSVSRAALPSWRRPRTDEQPVIDGSDDTDTNYGVYGVFGWQDGSKIYFRVPIGKNAHITPSIQYVVNPLLPEQDRDASSSAVVAGVRFHWSY